MRSPYDPRRPLGTVASAALGLALGLGILVVGVMISQVSLAGGGAVSVTATKTPLPTPSPSRSPLPTLPPPTAPPTPSPTATPAPLLVTPYQGQGLQLAALSAPVGHTYTSPITGTVRIEIYQYVDGVIREGATVAGQPAYPYIYITSPDREVKMRPGAIDTDVQLLVRNGAIVTPGQALFKTVGGGPSSWHTFYDDFVTAQVIASVRALPSGEAVDPVPLFTTR